MTRRFLIAVLATALASPLAAQPATSNQTTSEPRPIADADDPVNRLVEQTTVEGLLVELRIDGATVALESAQPARIPRRNERRDLAGDTVTVTALAGGAPAGSVTVPDELLNAEEGGGLVRQERRSIVAAVPTQGAVDSIEVRVSASGTTRRFDVTSAYAALCRAFREAPFCRGRQDAPR